MRFWACVRMSALVLAVAATCLMVSCSTCSKLVGKGDRPPEFSADVATVTPMGEFAGTVFVTPEKTRMELPSSTIITRLDKKAVYILLPTKMYMEQPLAPEYAASVGEKLPGETARTAVGTEELDGIKADKFEITYTLDGKDEKVYQWIDTATGVPVKVAEPDGSWSITYTNVKLGAQSADLFDVPDDYVRFTLPKPDKQ